MDYTNIISVQEAKLYLRIDTGDGGIEDDLIKRMISSACAFVENYTNVYMVPREKSYRFVDGVVRVYDWPISATVTPIPNNVTLKVLTNFIEYSHSTALHLGLRVGYERPVDVPTELVDVAYEILDILYSGEKGGDSLEKHLSPISREILNQHKRFII